MQSAASRFFSIQVDIFGDITVLVRSVSALLHLITKTLSLINMCSRIYALVEVELPKWFQCRDEAASLVKRSQLLSANSTYTSQLRPSKNWFVAIMDR